MKIAIIVTGFLRENETADKAFAQFFGDPNVDFFVTCWDLKSSGAPGGKSKDMHITVTEKDILERYISPKAYQIISYDEYCANRPFVLTKSGRPDDIMEHSLRAAEHFGTYGQRIIDMFYLHKRAAEIVNMDDYDVVIKLRHDMFIKQELPVYTSDDKIHVDEHQMIYNAREGFPERLWSRMNYLDMNPYYMSYQVTWGNSKLMKQYMNLYDYLPKMYYEDNVDITAYEHAVAYYIQKIMKSSFEIHNIENHYEFVR